METFNAKSVVIGRKPQADKEKWSAFISLFMDNNPHLKAKIPFEVLEYKNIDKVRINNLHNISFYLQGSDVVVNDLTQVNIVVKKGIVTITGKQDIPQFEEE
jgi:DNA primase large subunit